MRSCRVVTQPLTYDGVLFALHSLHSNPPTLSLSLSEHRRTYISKANLCPSPEMLVWPLRFPFFWVSTPKDNTLLLVSRSEILFPFLFLSFSSNVFTLLLHSCSQNKFLGFWISEIYLIPFHSQTWKRELVFDSLTLLSVFRFSVTESNILLSSNEKLSPFIR